MTKAHWHLISIVYIVSLIPSHLISSLCIGSNSTSSVVAHKFACALPRDEEQQDRQLECTIEESVHYHFEEGIMAPAFGIFLVAP